MLETSNGGGASPDPQAVRFTLPDVCGIAPPPY
jgi:hypothetical protein